MNLPNGYLLQNGKYRLAHVVGQGGFGITYKGLWYTEVKGPLGTVKTEVPICVKEYFFKDYCYRDPDTRAVKVHSETGKALFNKFKEKLIKEAKILSEVHHPYIVNVLEVFEENETAYIAMEYISGFSLKHLLERDGILPETNVLKYVRQIGEALQFVHDKSILHLDIKPSNILIDKSNNARLIDFGVSKRYDIEQEETSTTMLTLSKGYASIEQYDNEGTQVFSPRPDIYSLGATMYNLLTGKIPTESILRATRPLINPSEINSGISQKTEAAIIKAMQIVPQERFETIAEMLGAIDFPPIEEPQGESSIPQMEPQEDDTTLVYSASSSERSTEQDSEETMVKVPVPPLETSQEAKKKHKNKLVPFGIVIFALIGSAVAVLVYSDRPSEKITGKIDLPIPEKNDSVDRAVALEPVGSIEENAIDRETSKKETPAITSAKELVDKSRQEPKVEKKEDSTRDLPSMDEINTKYMALISSGKSKMAAGDFPGAKNDLVEAKETKLTEEVVRLIITCDARAEEKRITDKKALYEEKMDFGKFKIVRKKSNGRWYYGAIDANAEEQIPCKYLSVGKADNGNRAFERSDNLYDIYSPDGTIVGRGLTYY